MMFNFNFTKVNKFKNNHICVIKNGITKDVSVKKIRKLANIKIHFNGNDNYLCFTLPLNFKKSKITFNGNGNKAIFNRDCGGEFHVGFFQNNGSLEVGEKTGLNGVYMTIVGNEVKIGKQCMFASDVCIWGDGHSVLDYRTKEVVNMPSSPILIGDHVWLGYCVLLTKNAQIPNDCIVAMGGVVTKKFTDEHCVLGGNPAKIVKTNTSWHYEFPQLYDKKQGIKK